MTAVLTGIPAAFTPATFNFGALLPILIVFAAAVIGVLVEAFIPRHSRFTVQVSLTVAALLLSLIHI